MTKTVYKEVEIDIDLSDFPDDNLLDELSGRTSIGIGDLLNLKVKYNRAEIFNSFDANTIDIEVFESMFSSLVYTLNSERAQILKDIMNNSYHFVKANNE